MSDEAMPPPIGETPPDRAASHSSRRAPAYVVAIAAGALLADAAVETVASGSPVRWWAVGAALVYAIVTAATWRRSVGWKGRLTIALATILGLFATTAWLAGGLTDGIRLFGQQTPRIVGALVAAGIAVACFAIVREKTIPLIVRLAGAALAAYGALAFAAGAAGRVPLVALLAGASLWQRLPAVLQGAFVGGLIVLPLALVVSAVRTGLRRPPDASVHAQLWRLTAIATSLAIVLAAMPWPSHARVGAVATAGVTTGALFASSGSRRSSAELDAALANSLQAIEDGEREAPRDRWDPAYVASKLGTDPRRAFEWVRGNTFWIPYRGLLRGPAGVLMDRLGNSLDRAVLLATLLREARQTVRLAHGSLPRDRAEKLVPRLLVARARTMVSIMAPPDDFPFAAVAGQYHLDEAALRRTLTAQAETQARRRALLQARVPDQTRRLAAAIGQDGTNRTSEIFDRVTDALQDHWWVQVRNGESWQDFDLLAPDGGALTAPSDTIDPDAVPDDLRHAVVVRVIGEQWAAGALTERVALEQLLRPAELVGLPIALQLVPFRAPTQPPIANLDSAQALREAALGVHEWVPTLIVGDRQIVQSAMMDTGDLAKPGAEELVKEAGRDTAGFASAANDLFNPGRPAAPPSPGAAPSKQLTAAWIEYEIRAPGTPPRTIRRTVFDLTGLSVRAGGAIAAPAIDQTKALTRSLALMMSTEVLPLVCRVTPQFVAHLAAQGILANRDALAAMVKDGFVDDYAHAQEVAKRLAPMPTPLYGLARARFEWSRFADAVFIDRVNILTRHVFLTPGSKSVRLRAATDVVANDIGIDPRVPDPFPVRLEQGVLDTNAEAILAADGPDSSNAGWAFESATNWATLRSRGDSQLAALQLTDDVRRRISDDLTAGYIVVAPNAPVRVGAGAFSGWWHVDPATGHALGMGENGWGAAIPERAAIMLTVGSTTFLFTYLLCKLGEGGAVASLRCDPSEDAHRMTALDLFIAPLNAQGSDCLWTALNYAFAAAAIAGLGPIFGGAAGGAAAGRSSGGGKGGGTGGGGGGEGTGSGGGRGGGGGEPAGGGGGEGPGGGGRSTGGGDGQSGGGGPAPGASGGQQGDPAAVEDALTRADEAWARRDWQGWTDAMRDAYRAQPGMTPKDLANIPPKGTPSYPPPGWPATGASSEVSEGAYSIRPCALPPCEGTPPAPSPMAKTNGGIGGTLDVLKGGKQ